MPFTLYRFLVDPMNVISFVHDSAAYMPLAAQRMRYMRLLLIIPFFELSHSMEKGYKVMLDLPCWAHLLNRLGDVIFDAKLLPELDEYMRMIRLIFARYSKIL